MSCSVVWMHLNLHFPYNKSIQTHTLVSQYFEMNSIKDGDQMIFCNEL